ncbi:hypothetical protein KC887_04900 [Candidatus Kaiserbacteria bacterium]|nr:hypothetical protein [Candidatus Kaiserbacteria bacterium]
MDLIENVLLLLIVAIVLFVVYLAATGGLTENEVDALMNKVNYCMTEYEFTRDQCVVLIGRGD